VGYRDDEAGPIHKLVDKWKAAVPLHPEYGTDPNVFYVPPTGPMSYDEQGHLDPSTPRIPAEYIRSLFGEAGLKALAIVEGEREKASRGESSELMDILIGYEWKDMFGGFDRDPSKIEWT